MDGNAPTPGTYYLAFIINTRPHREYFVATPNGFYYRHKVSLHFTWNLTWTLCLRGQKQFTS